jgi:hypothetical protein
MWNPLLHLHVARPASAPRDDDRVWGDFGGPIAMRIVVLSSNDTFTA